MRKPQKREKKRELVEDTSGSGKPADLSVLQSLVAEMLVALGKNRVATVC